MVYLKRIVGIIQIVIGIVLILGVIFSYNPLLKNAREYQRGPEGLEGWLKYAEQKNITFEDKEEISMTIPVYSSTINSMYIIRAASLIVLILSVIMVLQGAANLEIKFKRRVKHKEKLK